MPPEIPWREDLRALMQMLLILGKRVQLWGPGFQTCRGRLSLTHLIPSSQRKLDRKNVNRVELMTGDFCFCWATSASWCKLILI